MTIYYNFDLQNQNTFGISCIAQEVVFLDEVSDISSALEHDKVFVLGGGSNILLPSELERRVVLNRLPGIEVVDRSGNDVLIKVGGGETWHDVVLWAVEKGYGGIENLALIPGTAGAAPIQNIGAYGVELKDVFHALNAVELSNGGLHHFSREDCRFGYRMSTFKEEWKGRLLITEVFMKLSADPNYIPDTSYRSLADWMIEQEMNREDISQVCQAVIQVRRSKLPDPKVLGNSGSFFKNSIIDGAKLEELRSRYDDLVYYPGDDDMYKVPTGWLIEKCGWKGKRIGNVGVYEKQALVLVHHGGGRAEDLQLLADEIIKSVDSEFGITITPEVNIIKG
jgi:UDP-N-acetylmuramate dehydrogenase